MTPSPKLITQIDRLLIPVYCKMCEERQIGIIVDYTVKDVLQDISQDEPPMICEWCLLEFNPIFL